MPELVERFHSEAKAIAKIDNENVLKIYDVGTEGEHHYMVVELLEGEEILRPDPAREEQVEVPTDALRILRQAANGLAAAHAKGIIHRDIKPQNLFLLEDGTVKVVDFGLARPATTSRRERVGTPHYMAPEVCETGVADLGSDVYALGIVLYHLLIGHPPYAGERVQGDPPSARPRRAPASPSAKRRGHPQGSRASSCATLTKRDSLRPAQRRRQSSRCWTASAARPSRRRTAFGVAAAAGSRSRSRAAVVRRDRKEAQKSPLPVVLIGAVMLVAIVGGVAAHHGAARSPSPRSRRRPRPTRARATADRAASRQGCHSRTPTPKPWPLLEAERKAAAEKAAEEREA